MEQRMGAEPVEETVRTGPWLEVYEDLSARDPAGLAAIELEALAEAAWWLCKTDESIAARQRAYGAFRDAVDDRGAARTAARLFHEHFYRGQGAVAVGWLRRGFRHLEQDPDCAEAGWLRMAEAALHLHQGPLEQAVRSSREAPTRRRRAMTETTTFDPAQYKDSLRTEWRDAAPGWRAWIDVLEAEDGGRAVSQTLVQLAGIGPPDTVLDVAAGYGEPGLPAARAVGPGGRVVCTDISAEMLAVGRERAAAEGLNNLEFLECDAEELVFAEASFDAVLSRQGLQFLPDVAGVLARLHGFLKPHGRLAAAVWGPPTAVQFAAPVPLIRAELQLPPPPTGPGPFALADADQLAELVEAAGFSNVETGTVTAVYQLGSPELATHWLRDVAPPISSLVDTQPPEVQQRLWAKVTEAWAPYTTTADGHVRLENQAVWVTGTK